MKWTTGEVGGSASEMFVGALESCSATESWLPCDAPEERIMGDQQALKLLYIIRCFHVEGTQVAHTNTLGPKGWSLRLCPHFPSKQ